MHKKCSQSIFWGENYIGPLNFLLIFFCHATTKTFLALVQDFTCQMMYAFLLSGLSYQNYEEVLDILDVDHFSQPQFNVYCQKMESVVINLLEPILLSNRNQFQNSGKSYLVLDGRWSSRGWNANECTVSFFNGLTGDLAHVEHIIRKMYPKDIHGN